MDPGNWSTDIAGGSKFGYSLLFIITLSSLMAMFLQTLSAKCGLATRRDLPQVCRDSYPDWLRIPLWIIAEIAIMATDLAEVIGSAVALKLLFGLPIIAGVLITAADVLILLAVGHKMRVIEAIVGTLVLLITVCFAVQVGVSNPLAIPLLSGFIPTDRLFKDSSMLYIAVGIIGATVMPHNLYLHSSIVLTRHTARDEASITQAIKYCTIDTTLSLCIAWFVNASILIVAATVFHTNGYSEVATLEDAYKLLDPLLGSAVSSKLFGIALLASGQSSTLTGTLTGQIVMEGFMTWKVSPLLRRFVTRIIAIVPAIIATTTGGEHAINDLLILSQILLCFALPFAVFPLCHITSSTPRMGKFVNNLRETILAYSIGFLIVTMNIFIFL